MTSLTAPFGEERRNDLGGVKMKQMLYGEYDVIDSSEIRGLFLKSTDPPGRFCKTGQFAMYEALYLRLRGSLFVPVKNLCL